MKRGMLDLFSTVAEHYRYAAVILFYPTQRMGEEATATRLFNVIRPAISQEVEAIGMRIHWDPTWTDVHRPKQSFRSQSELEKSIRRIGISTMPFSLKTNDNDPHLSGQFVLANSIVGCEILVEFGNKSADSNELEPLSRGIIWQSHFSLDYIYHRTKQKNQLALFDENMTRRTVSIFKEGYNSTITMLAYSHMMEGFVRQITDKKSSMDPSP